MATLQETYYDLLLERVKADNFPSHQLLNRLEAAIYTPEQLTEYVNLLLENISRTRYPSHQMLRRAERLLTLAGTGA